LKQFRIYKFNDGERFGNFKCLTSVSGNSIQVMVINQVNITNCSGYYTVLKEYYQKINGQTKRENCFKKYNMISESINSVSFFVL
jgi:hypothetical protein